MSDDVVAKRLSQFTPDGTGLDRDAVLFAAGRASARPNRPWIALASLLAVSQLATLAVFLWPSNTVLSLPGRPTSPDRVVEPTVPPAPPPSTPREDVGPWTLRQSNLMTEGNLPAPKPVDLGPSTAPLRAFGEVPRDLLN